MPPRLPSGWLRKSALLAWRTVKSISALGECIRSLIPHPSPLVAAARLIYHSPTQCRLSSQNSHAIGTSKEDLVALTGAGAVAEPHDVTSRMVFKVLRTAHKKVEVNRLQAMRQTPRELYPPPGKVSLHTTYI